MAEPVSLAKEALAALSFSVGTRRAAKRNISAAAADIIKIINIRNFALLVII
jgi:hypothetical protein